MNQEPDQAFASALVTSPDRDGTSSVLISELVNILRLIRVDKPIASAIFTLAGVYLGGGIAALQSFKGVRAALAVCMIVAFSFALNDVQDILTDKAKPNRPIPSGKISKRTGTVISVAFALAGIAIAFTLGVNLILLSFLVIGLSGLYSYKLKSTPLIGNILIASLISTLLIYGSLVSETITGAVWVGCLFIFLFTFSTEILFTIRDTEADRNAGIQTVAVRFGRVQAFRFFQIASLFLVGSGIILWSFGTVSDVFIITAMICSFIPIIAIVYITWSGTPAAVQIATFWMRRISPLGLIPILMLR